MPEENAPDPNAWRAPLMALAGDNADHKTLLEGVDKPEALFERLKPAPEFDWRKAMAGEDADELKRLERFTDLGMARKSWRNAEKAVTDGGRVRMPGEGASADELAEWGKAFGVAEAPDKYEIKVKPPEGYEPSENDKGLLSRLQGKLHEAVSKGARASDLMNVAHEFYWNEAAQAQVAAEERAADAALETETLLKNKWGSKYQENLDWAIAGAKQFFPGSDEEFEQFLGLQLASGHRLGDHPAFVQMFAQAGLQHAEDPFFLKMKGDNKGFDPVARKRELMDLKNTDPNRYASKEVQDELDRINAGLLRQQERAA